jgi:hypothetical protein
MKYAYLVTGSEDGPMGIFTSKAKALAHGTWYVKNSEHPDNEVVTQDTRGAWFTHLESENSHVYATIERFTLD